MHGNANIPDGSSGKRERTKQRNRSAILSAARRVFLELGYDAASVRDIVAGTELAPGTFYNYFPDKRSVLIALMSEVSAEASRRAKQARAQAKTLEQLVYFGFRAYFEFIVSDPIAFGLMRRNISTLRSLGIDETGFASAIEQLRDDLASAMAQGKLPELPLHYVVPAACAIAFETGACMVASDPPDVEGATTFAAELCLGGIERLRQQSARQPERKLAHKKRPRVARQEST